VVKRSEKLATGDKVRLVAPIVGYVVLAFVAWRLGFFRTQKVEAVAGHPTANPWFAPLFVLLYALVVSLALPVGPLSYGAGAMFGFWRGSILVWIGSMMGAVAGYYLARGIWSRPARRLLGRHKTKLQEIRKGNVFLNSFRMHLVPLVPGAFNYAAGISKLAPLDFLAGTALGIIPGTLIATFIGDRVVAGVRGEGRESFMLATGAALLLLAISFAPKLWAKFRKRRTGH